ncbi:MAG: pyridoxamine 5'-phosphate oxidase family protein [Gemmatimonadetes bacterium]|nr:pyridoxamine 5'-phosphate oxidase family protein [Gemmatimonadota bacterium]
MTPTTPLSPDRATLKVHKERAVADEAPAILAAGIVAHVGIADTEGPVVIPMTYHFDPGTPNELHLHGAHHSRLMDAVGSGELVCVTVTMADGLVFSKSGFNHSVNYRSVVCFCRAAEAQPTPDRQRQLLVGMIGRYSVTSFVTLTIEAMSAKQRTGGANGPGDNDPAVPGTAGVVELRPGQ